MNDMLQSAERLLELNRAALEAETVFEKAAIYGAVRGLYGEFKEAHDDGQLNGYAWEKVSKACHWTAGVVGYDVTNGHKLEQVSQFGFNDASTLISVLKQEVEEIS